jgi:hypothetical protein
LGQHRVALGQFVVDLESFGLQADHAPAGQVAQDADARNLQHVADLVGRKPGQGAEARHAVGAWDIDTVDQNHVEGGLSFICRKANHSMAHWPA